MSLKKAGKCTWLFLTTPYCYYGWGPWSLVRWDQLYQVPHTVPWNIVGSQDKFVLFLIVLLLTRWVKGVMELTFCSLPIKPSATLSYKTQAVNCVCSRTAQGGLFPVTIWFKLSGHLGRGLGMPLNPWNQSCFSQSWQLSWCHIQTP